MVNTTFSIHNNFITIHWLNAYSYHYQYDNYDNYSSSLKLDIKLVYALFKHINELYYRFDANIFAFFIKVNL